MWCPDSSSYLGCSKEAFDYYNFFSNKISLDDENHLHIQIVLEVLSKEEKMHRALLICRSFESADKEEEYYIVLLDVCKKG